MVLALEHLGRIGGIDHERGAPEVVAHDALLAIGEELELVSPAHAHQLAPEGVVADVGRRGLVVMVVQGLKMLGLADRFAPWAALAVSIAVAALMALVRFLPASEGVVYHLVAAAVIWLMATGIYHAGRNIKENI